MGGCLTRRLGVMPATVAAFDGVLAMKSGSSSPAVNAVVTYNGTEQYDTNNYHDPVTNSERITVPATGLYQFSSNNNTTGTTPQMLHSSGTNPTGAAAQTSGVTFGNLSSAIVSVNSAEYYTIISAIFGGTFTAGFNTWFAAEAIGGTQKYAVVSKSANQSLTLNTLTTLTFDQESADTNNFHDNVTNNSRLTVPAGVTCVRLIGNMITAAFAGAAQLQVEKNGSGMIAGLPRTQNSTGGTNQTALNVISAPLDVSTNDYFELRGQLAATANCLSSTLTWFSIEEVPSSIQRCLVTNSTATALSAGVTTTLGWDTEVYDTNAIHDTVTNNSRLTVPSGCTQARLSFCAGGASQTGTWAANMTKNGASFNGAPSESNNVSGADCVSARSAWVSVTPGDYFEMTVNSSAARNTDNVVSWFCGEFRA